MATDADDPEAPKPPTPEMLTDADSNASSSDSDSDAGDSPAPQQVEWLATARSKRSTAGNRMKSMLANEGPAADEDSDLELLFAEDEDDVGFTDKEDGDGSDVQMESSDDEDDNDAQDDLEGEKELERQAREKKLAARKRKAQEAIPAKFRKKVRISQPPDTPTSSTAPPQQPRPKKKSERSSWLPTEADRPTRASARKTTQLSKEQLHQQMIEREERRKRQVEIMERKAKKMEALKKPPMTQAERLREAEVVERRNAKSLNRWEEAEKQREEERRAKLAALNNRRLEGPVVTFWTGIIDLSEVQLKHVGKMVSIEEKPKRKRPSVAATAATASPTMGADSEVRPPTATDGVGPSTATTTATASPKTEGGPSSTAQQPTPATPDIVSELSARPETPREPEISKAEPNPATPMEVTPSAPATGPPVTEASTPELSGHSVTSANLPLHSFVPPQPTPPAAPRPISPVRAPSPSTPTSATAASGSAPTGAPRPISVPPPGANSILPMPSPPVKREPQTSAQSVPLALRPDVGPRFMPPPNPHLAQLAKHNTLTPPTGIPGILNAPVPPMGYTPPPITRPGGLVGPAAPHALSPLNPSPTPRPSTSMSPPPATPNADAVLPTPCLPPTPQPPAFHTTATFQPILPPTAPAQAPAQAPTIPAGPAKPSAKLSRKQQTDQAAPKKASAKTAASRKPPAPPEPPEPEPPLEGKVTRSCIILQDFDEDAIKKPEVQTQILFGRKMSKLASKYRSQSRSPTHVARLTESRRAPSSAPLCHHQSSSTPQGSRDGAPFLQRIRLQRDSKTRQGRIQMESTAGYVGWRWL